MIRLPHTAARRRHDAQVIQVRNMEIDHEVLHPDYSIQKYEMTRGDTGLLQVFAVVPRQPGKPGFDARWDDGSRGNKQDLDFDITGVTRTVARHFKNERRGYRGHHARKVHGASKRTYAVSIETPEGVIFRGAVSFNVTFAKYVTVGIGVRCSVRSRAGGWRYFSRRVTEAVRVFGSRLTRR
jgi:hypothetical protein